MVRESVQCSKERYVMLTFLDAGNNLDGGRSSAQDRDPFAFQVNVVYFFVSIAMPR